MFVKGEKYKCRDIHAKYGGQQQGGISTPAKHRIIFLFTGDTGGNYGYSDSWKNGIFFYTGESQVGDMQFVRGNAAIRDHMTHGKTLHLFEDVGHGYVRYLGSMAYMDFQYGEGKDREGKPRKTIVFKLAQV
jgi:5-methylcytosine-specific restriction enzyme A